MLEVKNLRVYYEIRSGILGRVKGYVKAVDGVSFAIQPGQTLGLVGESGSGKSSTGRAIMGLERIHSGSIFFEGADITRQVRKNRSAYRRNVQMIFQDAYSSLNPRKCVLDIIAEPLRNFEKLSRTDEKKRVEELLSIVGLPASAAKKFPREFSGGQRQRVGIARAVALKPKLIVADEPVSALDGEIAAQVLGYLQEVQREYKLAMLLISHDMPTVRRICGEIIEMTNGTATCIG